MSLPPRAAAVYVQLSEPDTNPATARSTGTTISDQVTIYPEPYKPSQTTFWASQRWYQSYPSDCVVKVHMALVTAGGYEPSVGTFGNRIYMAGFADNQSIDATYPGAIVYSYDPTPPPSGPGDTPPNPNGNTATNVATTTTPLSNVPGYFYLPRWTDDTAYDITTSGTFEGTVWPKFNTDYLIVPTGFTSYIGGPSQFGPWSVDLSVTNYQSDVLNIQTGNHEYYDYAQTTFDFKQTTKVKMYLDTNVCCWNKGTTIDGTVTFQSIDVTADPVGTAYGSTTPDPSSNYGFAGLMAKTGSTVSSAGSQVFSVVVSDSYAEVEITIPTVTGAITFINDFSVDSVTPPA